MRVDVAATLALAGVFVLAEVGVRLAAPTLEEEPRQRAPVEENRPDASASAEASAGSPAQVVRHRRRGRPPRVRLKKPRQEGPCDLTVDVRPLRAVSLPLLMKKGFGAISPVEARFGGAEIDIRREPSEGCASAAWFDGRSLHVRAPKEGLSPEQLELSLSDALPLQTQDGPVWWVYPRTTLDAVVPRGVRAGEVTVAVTARTTGGAGGTATLRAADAEVPLEKVSGDRVRASLRATHSGGALVVSVAAPADAPYLVIESLTVSAGGEERSLLSEAAL